jgi:hypothetical protein
MQVFLKGLLITALFKLVLLKMMMNFFPLFPDTLDIIVTKFFYLIEVSESHRIWEDAEGIKFAC